MLLETNLHVIKDLVVTNLHLIVTIYEVPPGQSLTSFVIDSCN